MLARMMQRKSAKYQLSDMVARMFYTKIGQIFISALFGIALAFMFQKVCKDRKCIVIQAPPMKDVDKKIFHVDGSCYRYTPKVVECTEDAL
jgi:hypothetical protein